MAKKHWIETRPEGSLIGWVYTTLAYAQVVAGGAHTAALEDAEKILAENGIEATTDKTDVQQAGEIVLATICRAHGITVVLSTTLDEIDTIRAAYLEAARRRGHLPKEPEPVLHWEPGPDGATYEQSRLLNPDSSLGVDFCLTHSPTCYRRGTYKLLIEVRGGKWHNAWGCFDLDDQPVRYFHSKLRAKEEAEAIAKVLVAGFVKEHGQEEHSHSS